MKKRYLPFGYEICDGTITINTAQATVVTKAYHAYIAGNTLQEISDMLTAQGEMYRPDTPSWSKSMVRRILTNESYCGTQEFPQIISKELFSQAVSTRKGRTVTYSTVLKPSRNDIQCGSCGAKLYWHAKCQQWFCKSCGLWTKKLAPRELSFQIQDRLLWICENSDSIRAPLMPQKVIPIEENLLNRQIQSLMANAGGGVSEIIALIIRRAELQYEYSSAGESDPITMRIKRACSEYTPTEKFPEKLYTEIVHRVILYRDAHLEIMLKNGQIL